MSHQPARLSEGEPPEAPPSQERQSPRGAGCESSRIQAWWRPSSLHRSGFLGTLLAACLFGSVANATIIERVVAVVGESPILLSDLRSRTQPFLKQMRSAGQGNAAAESELYTEMLNRMVDEELMRRAASKSKITVTREEIDSAINRVAQGNQVTEEELLTEIERSGVSKTQYRREIRRQLLDAKVMNLRLQGRIRVSQEELRREYDQLVSAERKQLSSRTMAIRIAIPPGSTPEERKRLGNLAKELTTRARSGEDFASLSREYSTDESTKETGGLLPPMTPAQMPKELSQVVMNLELGGVSSPIRSGGHWIIMKLIERSQSQLPSYSKARPQLQQRVQMKKMEKARRAWLDSLRNTTHVEMRL